MLLLLEVRTALVLLRWRLKILGPLRLLQDMSVRKKSYRVCIGLPAGLEDLGSRLKDSDTRVALAVHVISARPFDSDSCSCRLAQISHTA